MQAFKIQIRSVNGWSDLKYSDSELESERITETFFKKQEAINEMNDIVKALGDDPNDYRVVNYLTPEDDNLY